MDRSRVEIITDGIVAIAATIMVLQLGMPKEATFRGLLEQKDVFLAYLLSFSYIFITWHGHHNLFQQVDKISVKAFFINAIWIFILTLSPFTTMWYGANPNNTAPSFIYVFHLLIWSIVYQLLDLQLLKDKPDLRRDSTMRIKDRTIMYGSYILCLVISFFNPRINIFIIALVTFYILLRIFLSKNNDYKI